MNRLVVVACALLLAAAGTTAGVMLSRGSGPGRGPLYWDKSDSLVGEGLLSPPGEIDAMTVYGVLKGQKPAQVTSLRSLPVAGYPTPRVVRSALLTGLGEGIHHGWPANNPDFKHQELIGRPVPPGDNIRILVGLVSTKPGLHVAGGVIVDYTAGGRRYRTRLYATMQQCIKGPGAHCGLDMSQSAEDAVEKMARG